MECFFNPKSVAVVGASRDPVSVGYGVLKNLISGSAFRCKNSYSFPGKVYAINPFAEEILGIKCHPGVMAVNEGIDLAVVCVPAAIVPSVIRDCAEKKVGAVIILSAGFAEAGEQGKKLQDEIVSILSKAKIPMLGPNCLGIIRPASELNASFAPATPPKGSIALISQSGALADSVIDWSIEERYGFSAIISLGNKAMLDFADFIDKLSTDKETKVITLYIEGVNDGRAFMKSCRLASMRKPIVALKAGRSAEGAKAITSHTASLAGSYQLFQAAFRQSGVIEAETIEDMFDIAKALADQPPLKENSIAIVTNGGGCGVLCADYCRKLGINLAELRPQALAKLDASGKMHPAYSRRNPLDIVGDALPERYDAAINILLAERNVSGLIVIQTLQTMTNSEEDANIIIKAHKMHPDKPIVCVYMGGKYIKAGVNLLEAHKIPDYNDPAKAARAMWALLKRQELLKKIKN